MGACSGSRKGRRRSAAYHQRPCMLARLRMSLRRVSLPGVCQQHIPSLPGAEPVELDPVLLSRIQFAFVISFHILFPAFTIGLASWLAMLEFLWLRTGRAVYNQLYTLWLKVFA